MVVLALTLWIGMRPVPLSLADCLHVCALAIMLLMMMVLAMSRYVPYGPVHEVMPYLIRRVQENSSLISDTKSQRQMLMQELRRRLRKSVGL